MTTPRLTPIVALIVLTGCASRGPDRIGPDRFDYNQQIARSADEQMLLNLVRLRYNEPPSFLTVSSVLTQYVYSGNVSASGMVGEATGFDTWTLGGTAGVRYIERPTITYSPVSGDDFAQQMLRPIPTEMLFSLVSSGWPPEQLLMMSLFRINGLINVPFGGDDDGATARLRQFRAMVGEIVELARRSLLEVVDRDGTQLLVFAKAAEGDDAELVATLKRNLDLDPEASEFVITRRTVDREPGELTLRSRSLLEMMGFLAQGVRVPDAHIQSGLVGAPEDATARTNLLPFHIYVGEAPPVDAFSRVRFRDHWYWIDGADQRSKQAFGILNYVFQLQAPKSGAGAPLITVPAG